MERVLPYAESAIHTLAYFFPLLICIYGSATPNKSRIVTEGWGSRPNFQASYGLKMTPEDLEEGDAILKAM